MEPQFINGLRVTDAETMELAEMVLGKVNKSLVQLVEQLGVRAIGISGKDGGLLKVDKKLADGEDIGFVGDVKEVNADIIYDLLEKDFLPIIAPIGLDDDYNCTGVYVTKHSETSGLGAKAADTNEGAWRDNLVGQGDGMKLAKDGGDITAISGATITSRAVVTEVQTVINAAKSLG